MQSRGSGILVPNKSSSPSGKVCTVSLLRTSGCDYYAILIVDLASSSSELVDGGGGGGGYVSTAPTLLLDISRMNNKKYAFCVLGSFLYMFQMGSLALLGPRKGKSVCAINLIDQTETKSSSSSTLGGKVLDHSMLLHLPNMLCPKFQTRAILTPDAKRILVFSKTIFYANPDPVDFELFYPNRKKNPWKRLPSPKHSLNPSAGFFSNEYTIDDFTFITDSVFLIQTDKIGIFALDVNADDPTWQKIDSSYPIPFDSPFFVIEDHKLCIAADILREFRRVFKASKFPTSFADDFKYGSRCLADSHIIYKAGELFDNVCFQTGISKDTGYAHICLDVCRSVLDKYTRLEINPVIKTFKFVLDGYRCFDLYSTLYSSWTDTGALTCTLPFRQTSSLSKTPNESSVFGRSLIRLCLFSMCVLFFCSFLVLRVLHKKGEINLF